MMTTDDYSTKINTEVLTGKLNASIAAVLIAVSANTAAQVVYPNADARKAKTDSNISLEMCATIAFRKNNEKVCDLLETSLKPQVSGRPASPRSSVPTTSPNYGARATP